MTSPLLSAALRLAALGLPVFPLVPGAKLPAVKSYESKATTDPEKLRRWWARNPRYNIGISTRNLVVIDVDVKHGDGFASLLLMELAGRDLPATLTQRTPTGGAHLVYRPPFLVKQRASSSLAPSLDIRARGGYIVGAGSILEAGAYTLEDAPIADAPEWLVEFCGPADAPAASEVLSVEAPAGVNGEAAWRRAVEYLQGIGLVTEGGRNDAAFRAAARLKDFGLCTVDAEALLAEYMDLLPPLESAELAHVVASAFRYGKEAPGSAAPELAFPPVEPPAEDEAHPLEALNREHAYVVLSGQARILTERAGEHGYWSVDAFRGFYAAEVFDGGGKKGRTIADAWLEWKGRRTYRDVVFDPSGQTNHGVYNLWRGFAFEPAATADHPAVARFLEHVRENVCQGDPGLARWVLAWMADIFQRPWEKPLTALVMTGDAGTGKTVVVNTLGALLGKAYTLAVDERYITGNFNSYMDDNLLLGIDETHWAGNRVVEKKLKNLITARTLLSEHKGLEPRQLRSFTRVIMATNDEWAARVDPRDRRYCVLKLGKKRMQQNAWFRELREGMEAGGYAHLLRYFLDYPLAGVDVSLPPKSAARTEQKFLSLEPFGEWWRDSLVEGRLAGDEFSEDATWPVERSKESVRAALAKEWSRRRITGRVPSAIEFGLQLRKWCPSITDAKRWQDKRSSSVYVFPPLATARREWDAAFNTQTHWEGGEA